MDAFYSMVRFFVTGGAFMYPILIVFAVGAAIAIERYVTLTLCGARTRACGAGCSRRSRAATSTRPAR
jgi:biopolymer transport protein ExbB